MAETNSRSPTVTTTSAITPPSFYKLGDEAEKQVFIVGKAADGTRAGVKTTAGET
jgi:hypothetical protein